MSVPFCAHGNGTATWPPTWLLFFRALQMQGDGHAPRRTGAKTPRDQVPKDRRGEGAILRPEAAGVCVRRGRAPCFLLNTCHTHVHCSLFVRLKMPTIFASRKEVTSSLSWVQHNPRGRFVVSSPQSALGLRNRPLGLGFLPPPFPS